MKTFDLNPEELAELMRDTAGQGGWQSLLHSLQGQVELATGRITLSDQDIQRVREYAFKYGDGGWESRLRAVFQRHLGPDLTG